MRRLTAVLTLILAGQVQSQVVVGSPDIPSTDPFCAT